MGKKSRQKSQPQIVQATNPAFTYQACDRAIEYLFYALFFFVPLILWPKTSEVFEFNKMLFVYLITILIGGAWVAKWLIQKKITIRRTPLDIPILIFLTSQILSTIFSINVHTSLWGYYSRFHGGLMSTIAYIILYYAFVTNIKISNVKSQIFNILISASLVSLYGVFEHLGIDKNIWVQDVQNRVFSTLGQPNWLSAYLVALLPLPIFLAINNAPFPPLNLRGGTRGGDIKKFIFYLSLTALFISTIWFTKSQSGIGATAITLFLILCYFLITPQPPLKLRGGIKGGVIVLLLLTALAGVVYKWNFVQKLSPFGTGNLEKLVQMDNKNRFGGSDSMVIRQVVWSGARQLAQRYPVFGTGLETFGYTYYWVRPAAHNLLSEWEFLYNKAHNEYLNFLANTGFVGLSAYLLLIGWTIAWWVTIDVGDKRRGAPNDDVAASTRARTSLGGGAWQAPHSLVIALLFGYLSILITNYFGFSVVPIALFFFLFPAVIFTISNTKEEYLSIKFPISSTLGIFVLILITFYLILTPYHQWQADLAYNQGKYLENSKYLKESLDYLKQAVNLYPTEPTFVAELATAQSIAAVTVKQQLDALSASASADLKTSGAKMLTDFIAAAEDNATKAINMNHYQTNFYKSKAKVELYLGSIQPEYNQEAIKTLLALTKLAPTDAKVLYNLALLYDSLGDKKDAKIYLEKAIAVKPDYDQARDYLNRL